MLLRSWLVLYLALALSLVQKPNGFTGMSMAAFLHNKSPSQHMSDDHREYGGDPWVPFWVACFGRTDNVQYKEAQHRHAL